MTPRLSRLLPALLRGMFAGDLEEVLQDLVAVFRGDALGMELHAVDWQRLVTQAHDDVAGLGRDFELGWQSAALDDQRVIARGPEGRGDILEHALALVLHLGELAVHGQWGAHDLAAEHLADRLMTQAHAQNGRLRPGRGPDQIHAN